MQLALAPNSCDTPAVATIKRAYECMLSSATQELLALFADDIELEIPGDPALICTAGHHVGKLAATAALAGLGKLGSMSGQVIEVVAGDGTNVLAAGRSTISHALSGLSVDNRFAHWWVVDDRGQIKRLVDYIDTAAVERYRRGALAAEAAAAEKDPKPAGNGG